MPLQDDIVGNMKGREPKKKGKKARPIAEVVAGLSPAQRSKLRARAEEIIEAIDSLEEPDVNAEEEEALL
jgi:hypothetical protein